MEERHILENDRVSECGTDHSHRLLSGQHQAVSATFLGFRKLTCIERMCHSSTRAGWSLHMTTFTRPSFPMLVLQATNTGVRRPGYEANSLQQPHE